MHYSDLPQLVFVVSALHALITPNTVRVVGFSPRSLRNTVDRTTRATSHVHVHSANDNDNDIDSPSSRRYFLEKALVLTTTAVTAAPLLLSPDTALAAAPPQISNQKILVLGGTGFVGAEVCRQLALLQIPYVATSTDGRSGTRPLDVLAPGLNVVTEIESLAKGCTAVISCIGTIGSKDDKSVNAASGLASLGAKKAGVENFVYVGVAPEVRKSAGGVGFLEGYLEGKSFSEETIVENYTKGKGSSRNNFTLIQPTFIYGGDKFALKPPRVAEGYGSLVEGLLSSGPFRAAAGVAPGIVGIALEPPVKVSAVAKAAVAGALGLSSEVTALDTYDKINSAARLI